MAQYASPPRLMAEPDVFGINCDAESPRSPALVGAEAEAKKVLDETRAFVEDRDCLLEVINQSNELLGRLKEFGQQSWLLVYPEHKGDAVSSASSHPQIARLLRVASEFDPTGHFSPSRPPLHHQRAATGEATPDHSPSKPIGALNILSLNSAAVPGRRSSAGPHDGDSFQLMRHSLASMLCSRMESVQSHLEDLRTRVMDRDSRILITGDLNAGKSTFVNALLGREVAPTDQQPCTEVMCEILDVSHNSSKQEIHAVRHGQTYDNKDPTSYDVFSIGQLSELVTNAGEDDEETSPYELLKVYIPGSATPKPESEDPLKQTDAISLLRKGDISVSFIDSPGLNRDTLSTMELFSKQSTIDVVVFVVSAENQFTLSAQEFLWAASQEKAYVFVVVNKWGGIRDKVKAERRIREQLRKLSPGTWEERSELVHFVDSQDAVQKAQAGQENEEIHSDPFDHLQRSLSSFVFLRRSISKLQPAQTYTRNLLQDLTTITNTNLEAAKQLYKEAQARLDNILPRYNRLSANSALVEESVGLIEETTVGAVESSGRKILGSALAKIREGKLAEVPAAEAASGGSETPYFPTYDGLLSIFQYAEDVRRVLLGSLEDSVRYTENVARKMTTRAVEDIRKGGGMTKNLLDEDSTPERTFNPQAMFGRRTRKFQLIDPHRGTMTGLTSTLGLVGFEDLIDFDRLNWFGGSSSTSKADENRLISSSGSVVGSIGLGTMTLFGTGVTGGRAFVDSLVRLTEVMGREGVKRWTGMIVGVASVGLGIYLIYDIPRAVPRNIGRKLERELNEMVARESGEEAGVGGKTWMDDELVRVTKETRKVVRLAGWDLRQRFRSALEDATLETDGARAELEKAIEVERWLNQYDEEISKVLTKTETVGRV